MGPHRAQLAALAWPARIGLVPGTCLLVAALFITRSGQIVGASGTPNVTWSQRILCTSPPARANGAMAYDEATKQLVLFGGFDVNGILGDTWIWTGTTWSHQSPTTSPPALFNAVMAYDEATSQLILFGTNNSNAPGDTWVWTGTTWSQIFPSTSPYAAPRVALAYDRAAGQLILVGSRFSNPGVGTWIWNGTTWSPQSPSISPPERNGAAMAYDQATDQLVLFGGATLTGPQPLGDTWMWTGTTWSQQFPSTSPPARFGATMAFDQATSQLVLFGGDNSFNYLDDTWVWSGATWSQQFPSTSPPARRMAMMDYDQATNQMVLFGGIENPRWGNDTWIYETGQSPSITNRGSTLRADQGPTLTARLELPLVQNQFASCGP